MTLEQALHQRWRMSRVLTDLVPAERFGTAWLPVRAAGGGEGATTPSAVLPYVVLSRAAGERVVRTSDRRTLAAQRLRLAVWATELGQAKAVAAAIRAHFEGRDFAAADLAVLDMKCIAQRESAAADGLWRLELEFVVRTETPAN